MAGRVRQARLEVGGELAVNAIGMIEHRRHPADTALGEHDLQPRMTVEQTAEDEIGPELAERLHRHGHERAQAAGPVVVGGFADVEVEGQAGFFDSSPHWLHLGVGIANITRIVGQHHGLEAERFEMTDVVGGGLRSIVRGQDGHPVKTPVRRPAPAGQPLVERVEAAEHEVAIGDTRHRHRSLRELDRDVDAFAIEHNDTIVHVHRTERVVGAFHQLREQSERAQHVRRTVERDADTDEAGRTISILGGQRPRQPVIPEFA